jgi:hypothetical protein
MCDGSDVASEVSNLGMHVGGRLRECLAKAHLPGRHAGSARWNRWTMLTASSLRADPIWLVAAENVGNHWYTVL